MARRKRRRSSRRCVRRWWRRFRLKLPKRVLIFALVIWGGLLLLIFGQVVYADMTRPLGEALPEYSEVSVTTASSQGEAGGSGDEDPADSPAVDPPPTDNVEAVDPFPVDGSPICGGPRQMTILAVGSDTREVNTAAGLADSIRVVRVDFVTPSVAVITIPRNLWVSIPALDGYDLRLEDYYGTALDGEGNPLNGDLPQGLINASYFYGNLYTLPGGGPGVLANTIHHNLNIPVEHYLVVDMKTLESIIDAVGGLDITVPYEVSGFESGTQHMTGAEAVLYSRVRQEDNDWFRSERQEIVLSALRDTLTKPRHFAALPRITDRFLDDVVTDLTKGQLASLICLSTRVDPVDVHSYTISPDMVTESSTEQGFFILLPDPDKIAPVVAEFRGSVR